MKPNFVVVKRGKWWDLINYFYIIKAKLYGSILIYINRDKYHKEFFKCHL